MQTMFPSTSERETLAQQIGLTARQVQVWFQVCSVLVLVCLRLLTVSAESAPKATPGARDRRCCSITTPTGYASAVDGMAILCYSDISSPSTHDTHLSIICSTPARRHAQPSRAARTDAPNASFHPPSPLPTRTARRLPARAERLPSPAHWPSRQCQRPRYLASTLSAPRYHRQRPWWFWRHHRDG